MKKKLIIAGVLILAVIAAVFYFTKTENIFFKETSLYKAVPLSVPVFIELNSLKSIQFKNSVFERYFEI